MSSQDIYIEEIKTLWREVNGLKQRLADLMTEEHLTGVVGTVISVNGDTGVVVLGSDDIAEGATNLYFTAAEETKLAGVATGAEVNVNADWNAVSGDAEILNKPVITGLTQEEVEDFVGGMVTGNTETGMAVTYDNGAGKLNFDAQTAGDARYVQLTGAQAIGGVKDFTNGITFAAGADAITLYDEGTWSPVITGSGSNPSVTYTDQAGTYRRINNWIEFDVRVTIATISGGSGNVRVSLPITAGALYVIPGYTNGIDLPGTPISLIATTNSGAATLSFYSVQDNAGPSAVQISGLAAGDSFQFTGIYKA